MERKLNLSQSKITLLFCIILLIIAVSLGFIFLKKPRNSQTPRVEPSSKVFQKNTSLNRIWDFAAYDQRGKALDAKITFSLVSAQKTNQIFVKNKPIRTTPENAFLVLSMELKNDTDTRVFFYPSDFIRLLTPDGKKFEADIKNLRLEIAPFSTKKDKLAFLINSDQNEFQIQIAEIIGKTETIYFSF